MLVGPGATADLPPHVPVRGVEQSHGGRKPVIDPIVGAGRDRSWEQRVGYRSWNGSTGLSEPTGAAAASDVLVAQAGKGNCRTSGTGNSG